MNPDSAGRFVLGHQAPAPPLPAAAAAAAIGMVGSTPDSSSCVEASDWTDQSSAISASSPNNCFILSSEIPS